MIDSLHPITIKHIGDKSAQKGIIPSRALVIEALLLVQDLFKGCFKLKLKNSELEKEVNCENFQKAFKNFEHEYENRFPSSLSS